MKVTINDIAKQAGVAKSTVSRYLNGGRISQKTSEKIKRIIEEHNYEPNSFARSLKSRKTGFVGVVAPALDSFVTSKILIRMDEELRTRGYTTLISNTSHSIEREIESLQNLQRQKVDGMILFATELTPAHFELIESLTVPLLIIGQETDQTHCIVFDDFQAGYKMGECIASAGHKKISYIGVDETDVAVGQRRRKGIETACRDNGAEDIQFFRSGFDFDSAMLAAEKSLEHSQASAIICATDTIALGAMRVIREKGYRIPEDISVSGFGGYTVSKMIHPSLVTVEFDYQETGYLAASTIVKLMQSEEVDQLQRPHFKIREGESVKGKK
ncbi:LacI family DNA-binding transcriptional regulator [Jeotgalibacillus haloalkalitolerans]|uniref:LacI family DNA-binding transcriptional regulator n=1 Tax=Jeotgalibacillus haloalkalitolerans TaxID=3104292 RepID=A0ABU5KQ79_9BACL|nr:LacI family DNA-binding transcriptional regulator [Jeotgalibacillus sp. HH7-29]MDZ5713335.1 LacI family DNA-binding transcriptional regulator [Jeotgalibacillus sp. HH7-29]